MKTRRQLNTRYMFALPFFYLSWVLFVGTFSLQELLVGIPGALLAGIWVIVIDSYYPAQFSARLSDLLSIWRIPWYLISGTWEITVVAIRDVIGVRRARSLFRIVPFNAGGKDSPHATARRVLAVAYTTIAPNFIVLGVNTTDKVLLFHQLEKSSVPVMTQELGAQQ